MRIKWLLNGLLNLQELHRCAGKTVSADGVAMVAVKAAVTHEAMENAVRAAPDRREQANPAEQVNPAELGWVIIENRVEKVAQMAEAAMQGVPVVRVVTADRAALAIAAVILWILALRKPSSVRNPARSPLRRMIVFGKKSNITAALKNTRIRKIN